MKKLLLYIVCLAAVFPSTAALGQRLTINGYIRDAATGENLIGASLLNLTSLEGVTSNAFGYYSLSLRKDSVALQANFIGYQSVLLKFNLTRDTTINISLVSGTDLKEIEITAERETTLESTRTGTIKIPIENIKNTPALLGEADVLKVIQLLPGVQGGIEGSSGFYVRGGGPDQNLILLDGVPVYNASHLFGFLSVFNADAINNVELVKGGFPARYGGRLSSVVDITMKEGNSEKLSVDASVGLVASHFTVEGPVRNKSTSFILSGRRTFLDLFNAPALNIGTSSLPNYFFYDLNAKINHRINDKHRIYLSAYAGDDMSHAENDFEYSYDNIHIKSEEDFKLRWGNITTAFRWNAVLTKKLFSNVLITYSRYKFLVYNRDARTTVTPDSTTIHDYGIHYTSGVKDHAVRWDVEYILSPSHYIRTGVQITRHQFTPGVSSVSLLEVDTTLGATNNIEAIEYAAYIEDDVAVSENIKINAGLHTSGFLVDNEHYKSYQPRIALRYLINGNYSIKASYAQMTQYIHLLSNAGTGLPTDLWVPSTGNVHPQQAWIASGSVTHSRPAFEISFEGYYKEMSGLLEYEDGASFVDVESDWQDKVTVGDGKSYGLELFVQKKNGLVTGWLGYTLSKSDRIFPELNNGKPFPYRYDRRHDVEMTLSYKQSKFKTWNFTWVYGTGNAITLPTGQYRATEPAFFGYKDTNVKYFEGRNDVRMRAYHRMDVSYTKRKTTRHGERSRTIAIYNVYSRRNPFYYDIQEQPNGTRKWVQYSLFPIIPSISYAWKF